MKKYIVQKSKNEFRLVLIDNENSPKIITRGSKFDCYSKMIDLGLQGAIK